MSLRGARYAKQVNYRDIPAYLELGWIAYEYQTFDHFHYYGIYMFWICDCEPRYPTSQKDAKL